MKLNLLATLALVTSVGCVTEEEALGVVEDAVEVTDDLIKRLNEAATGTGIRFENPPEPVRTPRLDVIVEPVDGLDRTFSVMKGTKALNVELRYEAAGGGVASVLGSDGTPWLIAGATPPEPVKDGEANPPEPIKDINLPDPVRFEVTDKNHRIVGTRGADGLLQFQVFDANGKVVFETNPPELVKQ